MSRYRLTRKAQVDLESIWSYIASDNLEAAEKVEAAILQACGFLARAPELGRVRTDITALPVRFWTVPPYPNYVLVYDPLSNPLKIVRILHGARDLSRRLGETT